MLLAGMDRISRDHVSMVPLNVRQMMTPLPTPSPTPTIIPETSLVKRI